jgi:hypothetical protein
MNIKFVKRQDVINMYLDMICKGHTLTESQKKILKDFSK